MAFFIKLKFLFLLFFIFVNARLIKVNQTKNNIVNETKIKHRYLSEL
jgi:hypothetical protein